MKKRNVFAAILLCAATAQAQDISILNPSGLPIPRYVSLKSDEVNMRVGPGKRYPITWVYRRSSMPVQIIEEFAHWRRIKDFEGSSGWVHKGLLDGTRTALIMDKQQNLYAKPDATSHTVMRADPLVVGHLNACIPDWCQLSIEGHEGWIRKADIWGVTREEVFEE
ncbi:MAG: SH3 domain-containing protein [Rickettsiales bacterium]